MGITHRLSGLLTTALDLLALRRSLVERLLKTANLRKQRALLALELGDLARNITVGSAGLDHRAIGIGDLLGRVLKDGGKVRFELREFANPAFALKRAFCSVAGASNSNGRARLNTRAVAGDIGHTGQMGRIDSGLQTVYDVDAAKQRIDRRGIAIAHREALDQTESGGPFSGTTGSGVARKQQSFA